jgi:ribose 5-phosphate isomerase B
VRERGIQLERAQRRIAARRRRIALGADHGGFEMKEELKHVLADLGHEFQDFGCSSTDAVDYPDYAHVVARAVAKGTCDLGVMIDGAGIGSCMVANKVPGVRAAMCYDEASAKNSREHNGANVLTLGGKMISNDQMRKIVTVWLATELTEDRHRRRVAKIDAVGQEHCR